MDPVEVTRVTVGDHTFDVTCAGPGDGVPVVLLHGFPETAACWRPVLPKLAASGCRLIAPTQRGYSPGARPVGVDHYTVDLLGADVLGLLDVFGLQSAHLVGHDWGAAVAWWIAGHRPDRVDSLTAVSVPHPAAFGWALREDADQKARSKYIAVFRHGDSAERALLADDAKPLRDIFAGVDPGLVDEHLRVLTEPGALTAALSWYRAMGRGFGEIPAVRVPTTYVWSTEDMALGRAGAERCGDFVTGPYRFVELDGVGHWVPEEAPDALAEAIIERVEGSRS
ncbi:alpha/beta fold hydrolase [Rhodococcus sp. NPDC003318]|uniref:alpha/beta fold hydrolase n=1 Tax=Rhodococcus sp. NPDC003318 TaxID=3364503 RepID=UPI0036942B4D